MQGITSKQYILDDINATVDSNDLEFPDIFLKKNTGENKSQVLF